MSQRVGAEAVPGAKWKTQLSPELRKQVADLEERLKSYHGDDPLVEWIRYIDWIERNCLDEDEDPDSGLSTSIKQCCQKFYAEGKETKKYYNDERFVRLWIKMTKFTPPVETYQFMDKHGIGSRVIDFYVKWSTELEGLNDIAGAEKTLERGLKACETSAEDIAKYLLERSRRSFADLVRLRKHDPTNAEESEENSSLYRTAGEQTCNNLASMGEQLAGMQINRTSVVTGRTFLEKVAISEHSLSDSAYGASVYDRTEHRSFKSAKRPRDSLSMKRYDKLHASRSMPSFGRLPDIRASSARELDSVALSDPPATNLPLKPLFILPGELPACDWGTLGYHDPAPPNTDGTASSTETPDELVPLLAPQPGQLFMWDAARFPSAANEVSFEENLAKRYRKRRDSDLIALRTMRLEGIEQKEKEVEILLHEAEQKEHIAAEKLRTVEARARMVDDQQRKIDMKFRAAEEKQRIAEVQYKHAEDSLRQCAAVFQASKDLAQDFISSLALLTKDLRHDEIKPIDAITGFVRHLETKLGETSERMALKEQRDVMDGLRCVTENLLHAAEDRKLRTAAPLALHISAISSLKSNETIGSYEMQDASNLKDQLIRNTTHSFWADHPRSSAEQSNSCIKAMWNQTMNTMNQPSKIPPEVNPALVVHNEVTNTYVIPQPLSETDGPALVVPIRQSLAPRKSTRPLHTSAVEDAENLPFTVAAGPSLFQIFKDQSGGSGLQSSSKKDVEVDNAEEEDSENTPPLHSPQRTKSVRHCTGILSESIEHPGMDPEKLDLEKDFIEVTSDSDSSPNLVPDHPPVLSFGQAHVEVVPSSSSSSSTTGFANMAEEFNNSFIPRKSMGGSDQTLPFVTQTEFFRDIDLQKHMASTPMIRAGTDPAISRSQGRLSYLPPGVSTNLSPINERSREKSDSSSGGGVSTWTKSKKSIGTYSPLKENDEIVIVDAYAAETFAKFGHLVEQRLKEDPAYHVGLPNQVLDYSFPKQVQIGKTQIKLNKLRYTVEEVLGKGNFGAVYSVRCRSNSSLALAIKVQSTDGYWNYYMHCEAVRRVQTLPESENLLPYLMPAIEFHGFQDGSSLTFLPLFEQGTLMKFITACQRSAEKTVLEPIAMKFAVDILRALESLHAVNLIHGDLCAENFLFQNLGKLGEAKTPAEFLAVPTLVLTGFQCGIDLTLFDGPVAFTGSKTGKSTNGSEILSQGSWTYLVDLLGMLDVSHWMIFGEPLKVCKKDDLWRPVKTFGEAISKIWNDTFMALMNTQVSENLDLSSFRRDFEVAAASKLQDADLGKLARNIRLKFFMGRKSSYVR